ncbi:glycosyltransferase [sulfur-oxidizing endosymbiont of Gigantopelta aegis]|uniref:glycosyltransferase n=1 Tax=sulfur-oxidizing endosymbiont of Gigantopelta aegis TaxID=2794934 RepID=UPI0018DE2C77|nr:glycosyltransferase [sulfur-oxidizing endosymbiont of Gigantopelta aegis]
MRIAIYVSSLKGGGAERVMLNLSQGLINQGHQVDLLLSRYEGDYIKQLPKSIHIIPLKKTSRLFGFILILIQSPLRLKFLALFKLPRFFTRLSSVIHYINEYKPDAIISALHNSNLSAVLAKSCTQSNVHIIVTEHIALSSFIESVPKRKKKLLPLIKLLYPLANNIVAVSDGVKNDLSDIASIENKKITTIFNPVITPEILEKMRLPAEHSWLNSKKDYKLLAVGRLSKQKDFITLIKAISILKNEIPIKLIILGEGKERKALASLIVEQNLSDTIDLHGFVDNPFSFMSNSDLFVLSSTLEGLPTVLLEALAANCNIVSTDCPFGPSEILKNGKYGKLVPMNNPTKLADAIRSSYFEKSANDEGKQYALQFNLEKASTEYIELIEQQ